MSVVELLSWIIAGLLGAVGHEVAHWVVWTATGRQPIMHWMKLYVEPTAGEEFVTSGDRFAAAAPYLLGATVVVVGAISQSPLWIIFGIAMIQIPSRADVAAMRGGARWSLE